MSDFLKQYERQTRDRAARLPKLKADLLRALAAARATKAIVTYDGYGDSGQIEDITLLDAKRKEFSATSIPFQPATRWPGLISDKATLDDALDFYAWELLAVHHGGFENNDGGFGTLTLDVKKGTVVLDHNDRFTDCVNTVKEV